MNTLWSGPARDLILTFPLAASLAEAEHAEASTTFDTRYAGSIDQPALLLSLKSGISLSSNAIPSSGADPLYALGWEPGGTIEQISARRQQLAASHFGADPQLHVIAVDPDDGTDGENLAVMMRRGLKAGHVWLTLLRVHDAVRFGTTDIAVANLPSTDGPLITIAEHLAGQLRDIAAGTAAQRLHRTLISPETAAKILAVLDTANDRQRRYLLGLPLPLLTDLAWRVLGASR